MTTPSSSRLSAAKRNAESLLRRRPPEDAVKQEQQVAYDAMVEKTAYLRQLRLAKEAAEKQAAPTAANPAPRRRARRSKQT